MSSLTIKSGSHFSVIMAGLVLSISLSTPVFAEPVKKNFSANLPLEKYFSGSKRIEYTAEEAQLKKICTGNGYDDYDGFGKDEHTGIFYVTCVGDSVRVKALLDRSSCTNDVSPISKLEAELQGKLYFVQTLPGLSDDGTLIATYKPRGIHTGEKYGRPVIQGDNLDALHFSVNSLVNFNGGFGGERYAGHPFVVIVPVNQNKDHSILDAVTSISYTEVVVLGDYKLPSNAIIMYRGSHPSKKVLESRDSKALESEFKANLELLDSQESEKIKKQLAYYESKGFHIIPFHDSTPTFEMQEQKFSIKVGEDWKEFQEMVAVAKNKRDPQKKYDAVKKVILEHKGFDLQTKSKNYWETEVLGRDGKNMNTPELARKLFPGRPVSFGLDDYTQLNSPGEQWRSMAIRGADPRIPDLGFSIEEHHSEKFNEWLKSLNLPRAAVEHHLRVNRENRIAFRANDLIYGHFRNKAKAEAYIRDHLTARNNDPGFKRDFDKKVESDKSIDELAKQYCDFDRLSQIKETGPFNLTTREELSYHLLAHTRGMHPKEASKFFKEYFKKSAIFNAPEVSDKVRNEIRNSVRNYYVFYYYNNIYRPSKLSSEDEKLLFNMMNLKQGLSVAFPGLHLALPGHELDEIMKLNQEQLLTLLQQRFEATFHELYRRARDSK